MVIDADTLRMNHSLALAANSETLAVEQSRLGILRTSDATLADTQVSILVGDHIQAANVNALLLIGDTIEGDVKPVLDSRGALLFGLAVGGVLGLFSLLFGRRSRRD